MNKPRKGAGGERGIGYTFQQATKYTPENLGGHVLDWDTMPEPFKSYPVATKRFALPEPDLSVSVNIWQAFYLRRSVREFALQRQIPQELLSLLLWATQGITARGGNNYFRSTPSAGGLYPVETYLSIRSIEGLPPGIYHFSPRGFDLELLTEGDHSLTLAAAALGQELVLDAQVSFIWTAVIPRSMWKYRERAYRYIYLDAGHVAQNLYLAGTALNLGVCAVGAFFDDQVNAIIGVDGVDETAIYLGAVGWPEKDSS
jgi:SagB-type dehydrogenase family enzyme